MTGNQPALTKDHLTVRFRKGDRVVWNTIRGGREPHWIVDRIEVSEGLQPIYRVHHEKTGEVGSAVQWDLEAV